MTKLSPSPGFLLSDAARLMRRRFDKLAGTLGATRAQFQVLAKVHRAEGINQARLADQLDMEPISVCRIVDRMEAAGLVERRPDPKDRRARLIYMTEAARPALEDMQVIAQSFYDQMFAGFEGDERASFIAQLERIHANLQRLEDGDASVAAPSLQSAE